MSAIYKSTSDCFKISLTINCFVQKSLKTILMLTQIFIQEDGPVKSIFED